MSDQLYGVSLGSVNQNYNRRDADGVIRLTIAGDGALMTGACAETLVKKFKPKYPKAYVVPVIRGERDELVAESLADLGELTPLEELRRAVTDCVSFSNTSEEILAVVREVIRG